MIMYSFGMMYSRNMWMLSSKESEIFGFGL